MMRLIKVVVASHIIMASSNTSQDPYMVPAKKKEFLKEFILFKIIYLILKIINFTCYFHNSNLPKKHSAEQTGKHEGRCATSDG
jgi:hypothetical protein